MLEVILPGPPSRTLPNVEFGTHAQTSQATFGQTPANSTTERKLRSYGFLLPVKTTLSLTEHFKLRAALVENVGRWLMNGTLASRQSLWHSTATCSHVHNRLPRCVAMLQRKACWARPRRMGELVEGWGFLFLELPDRRETP